MSSDKMTSSEFEAKINPVLERFETQRKACIKKFTTLALVIGGLLVAVLAWMSTTGVEAQAFLIALVVGGLLGFGAFHLSTSDYRKRYKREVVGAVVKAFQDDFRYEPEGLISKGRFKASQLFKKGIDRYRGEDYVAGRRDKTDFEFSEVHAEYKTTSHSKKGGRRTHWHTIFKGIFFIADFHKDFRTTTVVLPDTAEKFFGFLGQKLQSMNFMRGELVKLEDPEFEREFCVYGEDQVEARYILSTALMRRILELKAKFRTEVCLSFVGSKVNIAIRSSKNRFEPKVFSPATDMSLIHEYHRDLEMLVGIVEDLNLNTRIWTKE